MSATDYDLVSSSDRCILMASKEDLKCQIAALQEKLAEAPKSPPAKRRRQNEAIVLAPATPSPRKKRAVQERVQSPTDLTRRVQQTRSAQNSNPSHRPKPAPDSNTKHSKPQQSLASSTFISQLKSLNSNRTEDRELVVRTDGFGEKPAPPLVSEAVEAPVRDDRLAIVEDLKLGPAEHKPIVDDPSFEKVEPNSGMRLKERVLPHASLQDHLTGRYFLPPSLLYSVVRLQRNKQAYEVPVEGDWVTIAVVAERGDVKFTSGPGNSAHGQRSEDDDGNEFGKKHSKENGKKRKKKEEDEDEENPRKGGKKFVHLKLIDLGHRSRSSSSSSNSSPGSLRGDAQLSLLLFESDYFDKLIERNGKKEKVQKLWRGGSGGAFEECFPRLREGTVIALLNPKVLKPYTNKKNPSSPTASILALTPPSASAIAVVGYAADLGRCTVQRRDGKPCGSWVDRRVSRAGTTSSKHAEDVCEYHIQTAVQRARAGRAEFSVGTSGMSTTAHKRKPAYDPARQWGLEPESQTRGPDGEATYVVGGLVASSGRAQSVGETMGREEQARARRKAGTQEDKALAELLGKGSSGAPGGAGSGASREALSVVLRAREVMVKAKERDTRGSKGKGKGKEKTAGTGEEDGDEQPRRKVYSAEMVKRLGFDPTLKPYGSGKSGGKPSNSGATSKFGKLAGQNREIRLGPPPGVKVRSGVIAPPSSTGVEMTSEIESTDTRRTRGADDPMIEDSETTHRSKVPDGASEEKPVTSSASELNAKAESDSDSDLEIESPPGALPVETSTPEGELE